MRPSLNTAIRSLIVSASSWSWVTKTKVMPTSRWIAFSSTCISLAQLEVERTERLVEQQHLGPVDQRAGQGDPLALAAGELVRPALGVPLEPDGGERLLGALAALGLADLLDPQAVLDVLAARSCAGRARSPGRRC